MSNAKEIAKMIINLNNFEKEDFLWLVHNSEMLSRAYLELENKHEYIHNKLLDDIEYQKSEITKLKKSREALRNALEFYGNGEHLNHNDHEIVELECEGSTMTDHIAGKKAREALKADDEIMKGE